MTIAQYHKSLKVHELKTWPPFFNMVKIGHKTFEVRKNDREFKLLDLVLLKEWNPELQEFTGQEITKQITYILQGGQFGVEDGYCVLGIQNPQPNKAVLL